MTLFPYPLQAPATKRDCLPFRASRDATPDASARLPGFRSPNFPWQDQLMNRNSSCGKSVPPKSSLASRFPLPPWCPAPRQTMPRKAVAAPFSARPGGRFFSTTARRALCAVALCGCWLVRAAVRNSTPTSLAFHTREIGSYRRLPRSNLV